MTRLTQLLDQPLSAENLDLLERSISCICGERGINPESEAGDEIAQRALILFYAGICDESDLRQALRGLSSHEGPAEFKGVPPGPSSASSFRDGVAILQKSEIVYIPEYALLHQPLAVRAMRMLLARFRRAVLPLS